MKVYVVFGNVDDEDGNPKENEPLHAALAPGDADGYLLSGLLNTFAAHVRELEPGGSLSVYCSRGIKATDDEPDPLGTTASMVINNPAGEDKPADRHDWDFRVERRLAVHPEQVSR